MPRTLDRIVLAVHPPPAGEMKSVALPPAPPMEDFREFRARMVAWRNEAFARYGVVSWLFPPVYGSAKALGWALGSWTAGQLADVRSLPRSPLSAYSAWHVRPRTHADGRHRAIEGRGSGQASGAATPETASWPDPSIAIITNQGNGLDDTAISRITSPGPSAELMTETNSHKRPRSSTTPRPRCFP